MPKRTNQSCGGRKTAARCARWLARGPVFVLAAALAVSSGAPRAAAQPVADTTRPDTVETDLIEIEGGVLEVHCQGTDGRDASLIVLESGYSAGLDSWRTVQASLARYFRVCSYHRAGYGRSSRFEDDYDAVSHARRLKSLKEKLAPGRSIVIVGHSLGGIVGQVYASDYAADIAGLVLLDSSHPDQEKVELLPERPLPEALNRRFDDAAEAVALLERAFPGERLTFEFDEESLATVEKRMQAAGLLALTGEQAAFSKSLAQAGSRWPLGDTPLLVISAGALDYPEYVRPDFLEKWDALQVELAQQSSAGKRIRLDRASHQSLVLKEAHSRDVVEAIVGFFEGLE